MNNNLKLHTGSALIADRLGMINTPGSTGWNIYAASPPNFFDYSPYAFDSSAAWQTVTQWLEQYPGRIGQRLLGNPSTCFGPYAWEGWRAHGQDLHGSVNLERCLSNGFEGLVSDSSRSQELYDLVEGAAGGLDFGHRRTG